jgi:hypothetical protein
MKTKIATALSIVGVLSAGSAAALVNTQILNSGPSEATASAAVLPPAATVQVPVPPTTVDEAIDATSDDLGDDTVEAAVVDTKPMPDITIPATEPTAAPQPAPAAAPSTDYLTAFSVGDSGVVTVDVVNGRLILVNASANNGWTVSKSEEISANEVEVYFVSSSVRVEFDAYFENGVITPSVDSAALPAPATAPAPAAATAPSTTTAYSDDDDDYSDDDYTDDDYGDDDHEDHSGGDDTEHDGRDDD